MSAEAGQSRSQQSPVIECHGIWKIFGRGVDAALRAARDEGLTRAEIKQRYRCVVGVSDVNLSIYPASRRSSGTSID
jgi:ABC-type proline/glycine betaine transport system ATPase subunit